MFNKITTDDAVKNFSKIIQRVANDDKCFVLTKKGEPVAALVSIKELKLLKEIKNKIDIEDALKTGNEPNESDEPIPWGELIKGLGF